MPATPPAVDPALPSPERDAEIASARAAFRELDKAWRATRTYGLDNALTRRFFDQLKALMTAHLEEWPALVAIVDRTELRLHGETIYRSEDSLGESLAFRLYSDGVREVRIEHGVSPEDLNSFLDALWVRDDGADFDDDVVTRLWAKDLATISFITAEDILQAPWSADLAPQEHGYFEPALLKLFVTCVGIIPIGTMVLLDTGELGVVVRPSEDREYADRPTVRIIADASGARLDPTAEVNLRQLSAKGRGSTASCG
jgi:hypothetical protein